MDRKLVTRLSVLAIALAAGVVIVLALSSGSDKGKALGSSGRPTMPPPPHYTPEICTQSVSPGASLTAALARAPAGAVICLHGGKYPGERIPSDATDNSSFVTLQPVHGEVPVLTGELAFDGARYLRIQGLSLKSGIKFQPAASHVELIGNDITGVGGIFLFGDSREGGSTRDVLIQGNLIHGIDYTGWQGVYGGYGIKSVGTQSGVTVRGNEIKSVAADYIQTDEANHWVVDSNTFLGPTLVGGHPLEHQDLWQIYAGGSDVRFTNNVARNTGTAQSLMFQLTYPGNRFSDVTVENNLFDHETQGYTCQVFQANGLTFRDNTVVGSRFGCLFRDDKRYPAGSGYEVDHNVFADTAAGTDIGLEGRVPGWGAIDHNVSSDGSATGAGSVPSWKPAWADSDDYRPLGLPFEAGYRQGG